MKMMYGKWFFVWCFWGERSKRGNWAGKNIGGSKREDCLHHRWKLLLPIIFLISSHQHLSLRYSVRMVMACVGGGAGIDSLWEVLCPPGEWKKSRRPPSLALSSNDLWDPLGPKATLRL